VSWSTIMMKQKKRITAKPGKLRECSAKLNTVPQAKPSHLTLPSSTQTHTQQEKLPLPVHPCLRKPRPPPACPPTPLRRSAVESWSPESFTSMCAQSPPYQSIYSSPRILPGGGLTKEKNKGWKLTSSSSCRNQAGPRNYACFVRTVYVIGMRPPGTMRSCGWRSIRRRGRVCLRRLR